MTNLGCSLTKPLNSAYRGVAVVAYKAWLGAGALTIGIGAAALACSGVANADSGTGSSARHTVSANHSPSTAAHSAPRPKPSAALIAASTVTGVANHQPIPAAAVIHSVATSSAPPNPTANAVPTTPQQVLPAVVKTIQTLAGVAFAIVAAPIVIPATVLSVVIYLFATHFAFL